MLKKTMRIAVMVGVLAAVGVGGSALAAAGAAPVQPTHTAVKAKPNKAASPKATDAEVADGTQGAADAETADAGQEAADIETVDGNQGADTETADAAAETGSEQPGNDGPGGHADEPGNPAAQHEAGGQTEE